MLSLVDGFTSTDAAAALSFTVSARRRAEPIMPIS